jgi:hypothetical protein
MTALEERGEAKVSAEAALLLLFGAFAILSWAYCLATGSFNGDFLLVDVTTSPAVLTMALVLALLPYVIGWEAFRKVRTSPPRVEVQTPQRLFNWVLAATFAWYGFITVAFGVGVMMREVYTAPPGILTLIQISNRIDPFYVGVLFILASPKSARYDVPAALLMVGLGLLRAGLGSFMYLGIALGYKYFAEITRSRRKILAVALVLGIGVPAATGILYGIRGSLREEVEQEMRLADLVFARLIGRLSSFSDTAYILQEARDLSAPAEQLDALYFQKQILGSLVHSTFLPDPTPEKILVTQRTGLALETVGFMPGVPGNLALAWMRSKAVFLLNLVTILLLVVATLAAANHFEKQALKSSGLLLLIYPLTSGVSHEFSSVLFTIVAVLVLFRLTAMVQATGGEGATPAG